MANLTNINPNNKSNIKPNIIMMGAALHTLGGVAEVQKEYLNAGLNKRVKLRFIPTQVDGSKAEKIFTFLKAIKTFIFLPKHKKSIIHLHLSQDASFYRKLCFMIIAKMKNYSVIMHLHGSDYETFMYRSKLHTFLTRWVFNHADHIIVLSRLWEKKLATFTNNRNITTLYNPVTPLKTSDQNKEQENTIKVLFLGRLGKRKGIYDLLEIISRNKTYFEEKNIIFLIAGDGELDQVTKIVNKKGLENIVQIPGWISGEEKNSYLRDSHIFVLPSYNEQMPMSILETMSYGYPILATNIAGIPEMVEHDINGYLFTPGDLNSFEKYLINLCTDQKLRQKMGNNSKQIISQKFDSQLILDQLTEIYHHVINKSSSNELESIQS